MSAGSTVVAQCAGASEADCFALKRSGKALDAKIDVSSVECDLPCVLIPGGRRQPHAAGRRQGRHGGAHIKSRRGLNVSEEHQQGLQEHYGEQFRLYLIQMGVRAELIDIMDRNSQAQRATKLSRDDWLRLRLVTALAL